MCVGRAVDGVRVAPGIGADRFCEARPGPRANYSQDALRLGVWGGASC